MLPSPEEIVRRKKYLKPHFLKVTSIFVARRPLLIKRDVALRNGFSRFLEKYRYLKKKKEVE